LLLLARILREDTIRRSHRRRIGKTAATAKPARTAWR
jgi:hypothetical protein